ncbi:MAG TPA: PaaI family thioesterase [Rhizobiaceae bacterium]
MSDAHYGPDDVQKIVDRSPFLSWMGIKVQELTDDEITLSATWRSEWVANVDRGQTQGGILGALIDFAANFAMFKTTGRPVLTVDLRIDYHRMAKQGDLVAKGRVIKLGKTVSTAEAQLFDGEGKLVASGRGTFLTAN